MEYTKNVHVLLNVEDVKALKDIAHSRDVAMSVLIREGVKAVLKKHSYKTTVLSSK